MKSPTRFFFLCFGLAAFLVASHLLYSAYLDSQLDAAVAACQTRSKQEVAKLGQKPASDGKAGRDLSSELFEVNQGHEPQESTKLTQVDTVKSNAKEVAKSKIGNGLVAPKDVEGGPWEYYKSNQADSANHDANEVANEKAWNELGAKYSDSKGKKAAAEGLNPFDKFDGPRSERSPSGMFSDIGLECEPKELYQASLTEGFPMAAHYRPVAAAYYNTQSSRFMELAYWLAFFILFIGSLPAIWYFLIRRLKEVAAAVRGEK